MRTQLIWTERFPVNDAGEQVISWDVAFKPDGSLLVVSAGPRLVIFNAVDGLLRVHKVCHQRDIFCLSVSRDGAYIASGGGDKAVSVWNWDLNQKYTFTHADVLQAVSFNPVQTNILATVSAIDFAIWSMPSSSVKKIKLPARACCAAWTSDGQMLTIGLHSGLITMRDLSGVEKYSLRRSAPIWDVHWAVAKGVVVNGATSAYPVDLLSVACWDGTISFYTTNGTQVGRDVASPNGSLPCSISSFSDGEFIIVAGSDKKATLMTRDGVKLNTVAEAKDWVWNAAVRPRSSSVAVVTNGGTIALHNITFSTVHGLYGDRYALRDSCTDVLVSHLTSDTRIRIKCRDYVKKVAVYKDRLAVQLPDRIIIYETVPVDEPAKDMARAAKETGPSSSPPTTGPAAVMYRVRDKIIENLECNLLVVASSHVVLCLDKKLALYAFNGVKEREWVLEAAIRYIKVVAGPAGGEGLLVGLKSGGVFKVFVNNPFPLLIVRHKSAVRCLDLSMSRTRLALVDESSTLYVYDCETGDPVWSEGGAQSVAWNAEFEDMLCFSGGGNVSIKTGTFPLHTQKLPGFVVGFSGSKVFLLQASSTVSMEVPQSASLHNYIEMGNWDQAYRVACLGVTPADWRSLGEASLGAMQVGVARAAFLRAHPLDMRYIELLNHIESARAKSLAHRGADGSSRGAAAEAAVNTGLLADVVAYSGNYAEAAKLYVRAGRAERAVEMFTDLRLWSEARKFAEDLSAAGNSSSAPGTRVDVSALLMQQAAWCEESGDPTAAASIYAGLGAVSRAVALLSDRNLHGALMDLVRTLPSAPPSNAMFTAMAAPGAARSRSDSVDSSSSIEAELLAVGEETVGDLRPDVRKALTLAGAHFSNHGLIPQAREVFGKLGDVRSLIQLHTDAGQWAEAHALAAATEAEVRASLGLGSGVGSTEDGAPLSRATPLQLRHLAAAKALVSEVHLARGLKLASEDRFEEALRAYEAGGRPDKTNEILSKLADSALEEDRFADAALHFHRLARDAHSALEAACANPKSVAADGDYTAALAARARRFSHCADVYAAYAIIHTDNAMPFSVMPAVTVFNAARFVLNACVGTGWAGAPGGGKAHGRLPSRVSIVMTLYRLAIRALSLRIYSVARFALERLRNALNAPPHLREKIDEYALFILTKPLTDPPEFAVDCWRCGAACPALNVRATAVVEASPAGPPKDLHRGRASASPPGGGGALVDDADDADDDAAFASHWRCASSGDSCTSCGATFIRSSDRYELLPLIEFTPAPDVGLEAALALLAEDPVQAVARSGTGVAGWTESTSMTARDAQSLKFAAAAAPQSGGALSGDARFRALAKATAAPSAASIGSTGSSAAVPPGVVCAPPEILRALRPSDVFIVRSPVQGGHSRGSGGAASATVSGTIQALLATGALSGRPTAAEMQGSPPRFFFHADPLNVNVTCCAACGRFFEYSDLENALLVRGGCPACRAPPEVVNI